jgi:hypothetical protein
MHDMDVRFFSEQAGATLESWRGSSNEELHDISYTHHTYYYSIISTRTCEIWRHLSQKCHPCSLHWPWQPAAGLPLLASLLPPSALPSQALCLPAAAADHHDTHSLKGAQLRSSVQFSVAKPGLCG